MDQSSTCLILILFLMIGLVGGTINTKKEKVKLQLDDGNLYLQYHAWPPGQILSLFSFSFRVFNLAHLLTYSAASDQGEQFTVSSCVGHLPELMEDFCSFTEKQSSKIVEQPEKRFKNKKWLHTVCPARNQTDLEKRYLQPFRELKFSLLLQSSKR